MGIIRILCVLYLLFVLFGINFVDSSSDDEDEISFKDIYLWIVVVCSSVFSGYIAMH